MKKILSVCVLSSLLCLSLLAGPPRRYGGCYYGGPRPFYGPGYYGPPGCYYGPPRSCGLAGDIVNLVGASLYTVGAIINPVVRNPVVIAPQPAPVYVRSAPYVYSAPVYAQPASYVYPAPAQTVYVQPAAQSPVVIQQPVGGSQPRPASITIQPDGTRIIQY